MSKVLVMMSTYNGERYIKEQLDSILNQKEVEADIIIRDDGSKDKTVQIIKEYCKKNNNIFLKQGNNLKPSGSFMWLLQNCDVIDYDYFAFCDQDDVWLEDKLFTAVSEIEKKNNIPTLYYCATRNVDKNLRNIDILYTDTAHTTSFLDSAIKGSLIPGCTMVFNKKLMTLLRMYNPNFVTMHDTWTHLICLSCGGIVIGDPEPHILYRQHENNVIGNKKKNLFERVSRAKNPENRLSLMINEINNYDCMSDENKEIIELISNYRLNYLLRVKLFQKAIKTNLSVKNKILFFTKILFGWF